MSREVVLEALDATSTMGGRSMLRRLNSLGLLRELAREPATLSRLAAASGLSRTAVESVVADLVQLGWVEAGPAAARTRPGRPAASFRLRESLGRVLSIDVGANHMYAVVADLTGTVVAEVTRATREDVAAPERLRQAFDLVDEALAAASLTRADVWILAVGSPGAIDEHGTVAHFGGTGMPGWIGLDIRSAFRAEFDTVVIVEGDCALGALAERWLGAAVDASDVVYVLCGIRTGAAVIVDGRLHRGVQGGAGLVGEMPELKWRELNEQYGSRVLGTPRPSREQIFAAAREGRAPAVEAVDEFADDLATGASAMVLALNPELLVIGGGSSAGADVFLDRFVETLRRKCPLPPQVVVSPLGSAAVAMGGVRAALLLADARLDEAARTLDAFPAPADMLRLLAASAA